MFKSKELASGEIDYNAWRTLTRRNCSAEASVLNRSGFAVRWKHQENILGFTVTFWEVRWASDAIASGENVYQLERTDDDVRSLRKGYYQALIQVDGQSTLVQDDQAVNLSGADVILVDLMRPLKFISEGAHGRWGSLLLRRDQLLAHFGKEPPTAISMIGGALAARTLYQLFQDALETRRHLSRSASTYMQLAVWDLLGAVFAPSEPAFGHTDKLFAGICDLIGASYADPDLTPSIIAAKSGISPRYLQKLFSMRGMTCRHFILSVRLAHASRLLQRRSLLKCDTSLGEIACASGFLDYTHFSRKFREHFGHSPSAHAFSAVRKQPRKRASAT